MATIILFVFFSLSYFRMQPFRYIIKYIQHEQTDTFVNKKFSLGYKPLINKPTRITAYSSTLINNIFTNELDLKHIYVVIADISDHLPIIINSLSIKNLQINSFRSHKRNMLHKDKFIDELKIQTGIL